MEGDGESHTSLSSSSSLLPPCPPLFPLIRIPPPRSFDSSLDERSPPPSLHVSPLFPSFSAPAPSPPSLPLRSFIPRLGILPRPSPPLPSISPSPLIPGLLGPRPPVPSWAPGALRFLGPNLKALRGPRALLLLGPWRVVLGPFPSPLPPPRLSPDIRRCSIRGPRDPELFPGVFHARSAFGGPGPQGPKTALGGGDRGETARIEQIISSEI